MREGIGKIISLASVREAMKASGIEVASIGDKYKNGQMGVESQPADSARGSGESCDRRAKVDGRFPIGVSNPHPKGTKPRFYSLHSIDRAGPHWSNVIVAKDNNAAAYGDAVIDTLQRDQGDRIARERIIAQEFDWAGIGGRILDVFQRVARPPAQLPGWHSRDAA